MGFFSDAGNFIGGIAGGPIGGIVGGAVGGIVDGILGLFSNPLDEILSQLNQQKEIVSDEAFNPIQAIVQQVAGGEVWKGAGADAFVNQASNITLPDIGRIGDDLENLGSNLQSARDILFTADEEGERMVFNGLNSGFEAIC